MTWTLNNLRDVSALSDAIKRGFACSIYIGGGRSRQVHDIRRRGKDVHVLVRGTESDSEPGTYFGSPVEIMPDGRCWQAMEWTDSIVDHTQIGGREYLAQLSDSRRPDAILHPSQADEPSAVRRRDEFGEYLARDVA